MTGRRREEKAEEGLRPPLKPGSLGPAERATRERALGRGQGSARRADAREAWAGSHS